MLRPDELTGWKAIAEYLRVSVRAAQEYEKDRGLPVHRQPGEKGRVYAKPGELEEWRANKFPVTVQPIHATTTNTLAPDSIIPSIPRLPLRGLVALAIAAGLAAGLGLVLAARLNPKEPSRVQVRGRVLEMLDQEDHPMWHFTLPGTPSPIPDQSHYECARPLIADIDGDGRKELLYRYYPEQEAPGEPDTLYCFSSAGRARWTRQIGRELTTIGGQGYPKQYSLNWILKLPRPTPNGGLIVVGARRGGTSIFCVELLTKDGQVVGQYFHPGWLWASAVMDLDGDGFSEIILGGVNNAYGNVPGFEYPMTLVVLDSRFVEGEGPAPPPDSRHFPGLVSGRERAVLLMRNFGQLPSDGPEAFCNFVSILARDGHFEAMALKQGAGDLRVEYQFDRHLNLEYALPSARLLAMLNSKVKRPLSDVERRAFYVKEFGDIRVLKNDFANR